MEDRSRAARAGTLSEAPQHILVVDDDDLVRATLRTLCERSGYDVAEATNGSVALERVSARRPQLVITDVVMPIMDGLELSRRLRAEHTDVKILALSGSPRVAERMRAEPALQGVDARALSKMVGIGEILSAIHELIGPPPPRAV